jgi:UDP-N-acetylmuramoyl-tripeptide--D-alanyl-D-alanine ligase
VITLMIQEVVRALGGSMSAPREPFGVRGVSTDTRTLQPGELFFALSGERFDGHAFVAEAFAKGACAAVVAQAAVRGAGPTALRRGPLIAVADPREALGRLAAYHRTALGGATKVIAVTGSNGKTTTKSMIDHVLRSRLPGRAAPASFNNDVGVPLTLLSAETSDRYLVVEIGSSAPGEVARLASMAKPDIGVVTSIGYAHLEGFGGFAGVVREKLSLLDHIATGGLGVVNLDDLRAVEHAPLPDALRMVTFGLDSPADVRVTSLQCRLEGAGFLINDRYLVRLPVPGAHNARNAAAAFAVARRMQMEPEQIIAALGDVQLPKLRLNLRRLSGVTLIEDCYNANPSSMAAGIEVLRGVKAGRRVLVVGQMLELGAESAALHKRIGAYAARAGIDVVVSVGDEASSIVEGVRSADPSVETHACASTDQACAEVPALLDRGDTVLVKGSRAMRLERVAEGIVARFAARDRNQDAVAGAADAMSRPRGAAD